MEAPSYTCAACGGRVSEAARRCPYCAAPVATVRCATCFHMNVPEAAHCSACGRALGLEPIGEAGPLRCPDCEVALTRYASGPGALHDCERCGGQFAEHAMLAALIESQAATGAAVPRVVERFVPPSTRVRYRPCPACGELMGRKNFGEWSGVIVDVCKRHGTWLDAGELGHVLAFVASGGLADAWRRAREESDRRRAAMRVEPIAAAHASASGGNRAEALTALTEGALDVLGVLLDL